MDNDHHIPNTVWLESLSDKLIAFMDSLRNDRGYTIGVEQYSAAQKLLLALAATTTHDDMPDEQAVIERLKPMIGPLLCTSPEQQNNFQRQYDAWFPPKARAFPAPVPEFIEGVEGNKPTLNQRLGEIEDTLDRLWLTGLVVFATIVVLAGLALPFVLNETPPVLDEPTITQSPPNIPTTTVPVANASPTSDVSEPTSTPVFAIIYTPTATLSVKPELTPTEPRVTSPPGPIANIPTPWLWLGTLSLLLVMLVGFMIMRWKKDMVLERLATSDAPPDIMRLAFNASKDDIVPSMDLFLTARNMRQRVPVPSDDLDVNATVVASIARGGWFTPVYLQRQVRPEYLILVDRASHRDHQATFVTHVLDSLKEHDVYTTVYAFDEDPRLCFPTDGKGMPCTLRELTHRYADKRLILFSDASRLFSPMTGEKEAWTTLFEAWAKRTIMTPVVVEHWGYQEHILKNEFTLLPATTEGLLKLADTLSQDDTAALATGQTRGPFPDELRMRPLYWTSRNAPDDEEITRMLHNLRGYLDDASFLWLCACAVFPHLDWNLTLYLGQTLSENVYTPQRLIALSRLPWFRQGYLPDWLRERLIGHLSETKQEEQVRAVIENLLGGELQQDAKADFSLEVAPEHRKTLRMVVRHLLHTWARKAPHDSPLKDYIFVRFMHGKKLQPLWVRVPERLREMLGGKRKRWSLGVSGALILALGILLFIASQNQVSTPEPPNVSYPVTLDEWRGESRNLSQTFTREGQHYWRYVRPGTYPIGGWTDVDTESNNDATATLDLPGYWIGKYPVTVQQYRQFINAGGYDNRAWWTDNGWAWKEDTGRTQPYLWNDAGYNSDDQPVLGVTWYEAMAYVRWLNAELADVLPEGYRVQLPTEAEWEVACAYDEAGQRHTYPWGEQEPSSELADGDYGQGNNTTAAVGGRPAGAAACGAHDMVGSVWAWSASSYGGYAAESGTRVADFMTSDGDVPLRGASWWNETDVLLCAARNRFIPIVDYLIKGFRLVLSP